jgi:hypothetical protein
MNCILNVNECEYDKILQLNHDAVVWKTSDHHLLQDLETLLGDDTIRQMSAFEECRMQKQPELDGHARIEPAKR